jgi:hypothetical protein
MSITASSMVEPGVGAARRYRAQITSGFAHQIRSGLVNVESVAVPPYPTKFTATDVTSAVMRAVVRSVPPGGAPTASASICTSFAASVTLPASTMTAAEPSECVLRIDARMLLSSADVTVCPAGIWP